MRNYLIKAKRQLLEVKSDYYKQTWSNQTRRNQTNKI